MPKEILEKLSKAVNRNIVRNKMATRILPQVMSLNTQDAKTSWTKVATNMPDFEFSLQISTKSESKHGLAATTIIPAQFLKQTQYIVSLQVFPTLELFMFTHFKLELIHDQRSELFAIDGTSYAGHDFRNLHHGNVSTRVMQFIRPTKNIKHNPTSQMFKLTVYNGNYAIQSYISTHFKILPKAIVPKKKEESSPPIPCTYCPKCKEKLEMPSEMSSYNPKPFMHLIPEPAQDQQEKEHEGDLFSEHYQQIHSFGQFELNLS